MPDPVRFNVSHTNGLALVAVTRGREVGIDVERVQPGIAIGSVAAHVLGAGEADALAALPERERVEAFFVSWTRREAHAKARGDGLAPPGDRPAWWLTDLTPMPGYAAALAVEGGECDVRTQRWL